MKRLPVILALAAIALAFNYQEEKNFFKNDDFGFIMYKPPKNKEWECKDKSKFLKDPLACVGSRIKDLEICAYVQAIARGQNVDVKKAADDQVDAIKKSESFKKVKVKSNKKMKFPGTQDTAYYVEIEVTLKDDRALMWNFWRFVSKKNKNLFTIYIVGEESEYKKKENRRAVFQVLGMFNCFKTK